MVSQVTLLGRAAIFAQTERLEPPHGKLTALLYYLAYQGDWVSRDDLVYLFYPDTLEHKAKQNLRTLLTTLRRLDYAARLETEPTRLRWNVQTDVQAFRDALEKNRPAQAVTLYRGVLLEDFSLATAPEFESWLAFERAELGRRWRRAALELASSFERDARYPQAADLLERLHRDDPFDEEVLRRYLTALTLAARASEALQTFETFTATLKRDVEGDPEAATLQLIESIRQGQRPSFAAETAVRISANMQRSHLKIPNPTTAFIGRETDIAKLSERLRDPACRLLSIVAPGGMGKTRLALEVGKRLAPGFSSGVCFVPFDAVSSPELMVSAVADALSFTFFGPQQPEEQLLEYLQSQSLLLVLDNLEHLLNDLDLVTKLLERAPKLKLLVTSRERLNLHAEWLYDLAGMNVPETDNTARDGNVQETDAVALFVQSAKQARADFTLDSNAQAVARICQLVGGMPLALELAASWLRVLSADEIAAELDQGLDLLESSLRDLPARHHDVRRVFESSWQRLSAGEQTALRKLSVFQGGFTKEAAGEVAEVSLPLLLALSNKSFVRLEASGRFTQHPLMWQYVREKAESETESFAQTQEEHAGYFAAFMYEREALHQSMAAKSVRAELEKDIANIRAAWFWAADHAREDLLSQISEGLLELYSYTRRYHEGEVLFAYAVNQLQSRSVVHGRILRNLGYLHNWQTDYLKGAEILEQSAAIFQKHRATFDEALALEYLALSHEYTFRPSHETEAVWHRCVKLFREVGDTYREARALVNISLYCRVPLERETHLRESIRLFREVESYFFGLTLGLSNLAGYLAQTHGAYQDACEHLSEAVSIERVREMMPFRLAWWLNLQGRVQSYRGNFEEASACHQEARSIGETLEPGFGAWELDHALWGLGRLAFLRGELGEAARYLNEALELNLRHPDPFGLRTDILQAQAAIALKENRFDNAAELSRAAWGHFKAHKRETYEHAWIDSFCRCQLGEIAFANGDVAEAAEYFRQALNLVQEWHLLPAALHLLVNFADLQRDEGRAVRLLQLVVNHPASMFETREAARRRLEGFTLTGLDQSLEPVSVPVLNAVVREILSSTRG